MWRVKNAQGKDRLYESAVSVRKPVKLETVFLKQPVQFIM